MKPMTREEKKEYLKKFIRKYHKNNSACPRQILVHKHTDWSIRDINDLFQELLKEGFISQKENNFVLNAVPALPVTIEEKAEEIKPFTPQVKKKLRISSGFIHLIMFCISIICICISIYYSAFWLSAFMFPALAYVLAAALVTFGTFAPQSIALIKKYRTGFLRFLLRCTMIVIIGFSMLSTIAGQYNSRSINLESESKETKEETTNNKMYKQLEKEVLNFENDIASLKKERDKYQQIFDAYTAEDVNTKNYNNTSWRIANAKSEINKKEKEKAQKETELKNLLIQGASSDKQRQDFYTWVGSITGTEPDKVEFFMSIFPAVIIDILAPLGMYIGLGMYRRKGKYEFKGDKK